jgi:hypothetical protein
MAAVMAAQTKAGRSTWGEIVQSSTCLSIASDVLFLSLGI